MFHVEHGRVTFEAIEKWLGIDIDTEQRAALGRFERWLADEAVPAGGLGPGELDRLFDRHILDSLAFLAALPGHTRTAVDVGGGVGLPSIPLAIVRPDIDFVLVDRSRRRTDLASRAGRILGVRNYAVLTTDISSVEPVYDVALFRASLPIPEAAEALPHCSIRGGTGLLAVSRGTEEPSLPSAPDGVTFAMSREGDGILASPFWLLEMRKS